MLWMVNFGGGILTVVLFILHTYWGIEYYRSGEASNSQDKIMMIFNERCLRFIASLPVVMLYYLYGKRISYLMSSKIVIDNIVRIAKYSFGIYLLQEITIRLFYYSSVFQSVLSGASLPLIVFFLSFTISYVASYAMSRTKATKWLLG